MQLSCKQCGTAFELTAGDIEFYDKVSPVFSGKKYAIPPPNSCAMCRMQHRLAFRNEHHLYKRKSDLSGREIISIYSPDKPFIVYDQPEWWNDKWDAINLGKDIDWNAPFFTQYGDLYRTVPRISMFNVQSENSDYCNQAIGNRNCFLSFAVRDCDSVLYGAYCTKLKNCCDVAFCHTSELLYDCTDTYESYNGQHLHRSINCTDSQYLYDCMGCKNCIGCAGLRNKEFHVFNAPVQAQEYRALLQSIQQDPAVRREVEKHFDQVMLRTPRNSAWIKNGEQVTGDNIKNAKNCANCFDVFDLEDCSDCTWIFDSRDCKDCYGMGSSELTYDSIGVVNASQTLWSIGASSVSNCIYTDLCISCKNCFGCISLKNKEHCIFNKQYSKMEYEEIVPRLIKFMQSKGEWGMFFPSSLSPYGYNETVAHEEVPLTPQKATESGFSWSRYEMSKQDVKQTISASMLPIAINDVSDDVLHCAISSEETQRPFRITQQELQFYRNQRIPLPHLHPDERHLHRMALRNPRKLWKRNCAKCSREIQTTYQPSRPEIVHCETCYLKEMY